MSRSVEFSGTKNSGWLLIFICWIISCISILGSLFFSEVMFFIPCTLCWYQRICMYPLFLLFLPAVLSYDRSVLKYSMPLSFLGWFVALYHNLVQYKIIPESASPCSQGISCSMSYIQWFDFITIPFLSFIAFSVLCILQIFIFLRMDSRGKALEDF